MKRFRIRSLLVAVLLIATLCLYLKYEYRRRFVSLATLVARFNDGVAAESNGVIQPLTIDEVVQALKATAVDELISPADTQVAAADTLIDLAWEGERIPAQMRHLERLCNSSTHRRDEERFVIRILVPSGRTKRGEPTYSPTEVRTIGCPDEPATDPLPSD